MFGLSPTFFLLACNTPGVLRDDLMRLTIGIW